MNQIFQALDPPMSPKGSALAAPRCNKTSLGAVAVSAETREVKAGDEVRGCSKSVEASNITKIERDELILDYHDQL